MKSFEENIEALHKFFSFPSSCRVESSTTPLCSMLPLCKKRLPGALGPFLFTDYIYIVKTGIFSQVSWSQVLNPRGGKEWDAAPLRVDPKILRYLQLWQVYLISSTYSQTWIEKAFCVHSLLLWFTQLVSPCSRFFFLFVTIPYEIPNQTVFFWSHLNWSLFKLEVEGKQTLMVYFRKALRMEDAKKEAINH